MARRTATNLVAAVPKEPTWDDDDEHILQQLQERRSQYIVSKVADLSGLLEEASGQVPSTDQALSAVLADMQSQPAAYIAVLQPFVNLEQGE